MKRLPILCPSVGSIGQFMTQPCSRSACFGWKAGGGCGEGEQVNEVYAKFLDKDPVPPACPIAGQCRWHLDAIARGERACPPRRLGMLCAHQGGEWNTFEMAPPEDWEQSYEPDEEDCEHESTATAA